MCVVDWVGGYFHTLTPHALFFILPFHSSSHSTTTLLFATHTFTHTYCSYLHTTLLFLLPSTYPTFTHCAFYFTGITPYTSPHLHITFVYCHTHTSFTYYLHCSKHTLHTRLLYHTLHCHYTPALQPLPLPHTRAYVRLPRSTPHRSALLRTGGYHTAYALFVYIFCAIYVPVIRWMAL